MRLSPKIRNRHFYLVPQAGGQVGWSRAGSYRAKDDGIIPVEKVGRFLLVPRKRWDRIRKQILSGKFPKPEAANPPKARGSQPSRSHRLKTLPQPPMR
jgi:hypothetical protein